MILPTQISSPPLLRPFAVVNLTVAPSFRFVPLGASGALAMACTLDPHLPLKASLELPSVEASAPTV